MPWLSPPIGSRPSPHPSAHEGKHEGTPDANPTPRQSASPPKTVQDVWDTTLALAKCFDAAMSMRPGEIMEKCKHAGEKLGELLELGEDRAQEPQRDPGWPGM